MWALRHVEIKMRELIYGRNAVHECLRAKRREVYKLIRKVAPTDCTVLIIGESGTGKDLTAKAIHNQSRRRNEKFLAVDISTLSTTLLESELFGHVK